MKNMGWAGGLLACWIALAAAQGQQPAPAPGETAQNGSAQQQAKQKRPAQLIPENAGEVKFQQNCSRCHNAPQELSPRISGTVVLHMRARASLSEADAKAILRYLAP
jgi:cytochrome c5